MQEQHNQEAAKDMADRHIKVETLMEEIDERIARFCALTGANGKPVKKRWRSIKQSSRVALPQQTVSTQEAVDKAARDYFVSRGYVVGDGTWEFEVTMISRYGSKHLMVLLAEEEKEEADLVYQAEASTLEKVYADALDFFKNGGEDNADL